MAYLIMAPIAILSQSPPHKFYCHCFSGRAKEGGAPCKDSSVHQTPELAVRKVRRLFESYHRHGTKDRIDCFLLHPLPLWCASIGQNGMSMIDLGIYCVRHLRATPLHNITD